ncbi:MAG: TIGR04013 family B12-binding domain/radical SAM domain-containing protein, partial [Polyangiales bacterium]
MTGALPTLVVHHARNGVVALNVLTAALRADASTAAMTIRFAKDGDAVIDETVAAGLRGERVVVAWSFYSPEVGEVFLELARVKNALSERGVSALQLAGGVHASAEPRATLDAGFDLVALGEGERTLIELMNALGRGDDPAGIEGLGRLEQGSYRSTGSGHRVALDDYPAFNVPDRKFNAIEITRGCIYACKFCQTPFMFKAKFRHRSLESVREHVRIMRRERLRFLRFLTPTSLSYGSDDTQPNLAAVEALLAMSREEIGPEGKVFFGTFPSEVRPEHVTREALAILRRYVDNDNLVIGGQSGSQRVLDESRRDHSVEDVVRAAKLCIEGGFRPNVDLLFGLPGEEDADVHASVVLMRALADVGARVHTHAFMPLPGTPFKDAPAGKVAPEAERELG